MKRYITLPNQKPVGLHVYAKAWRICKSMCADGCGGKLVEGFFDWPEPAQRVLASMRHGLHDRINMKMPWFEKGRRWKTDQQVPLMRDAARLRDIREHRIRVYQFESDLCRKRFGHLLARHDD